MSATTTRPAFRPAWTDGAKARPEADTFAAAREGLARKRRNVVIMMSNDGEAGDHDCTICGGTLRELSVEDGVTMFTGGPRKPEPLSLWEYVAADKTVTNGRHSVCDFAGLVSQITTIREGE